MRSSACRRRRSTTNVAVTVDGSATVTPSVLISTEARIRKDSPTITDSGLSVVRWGGNSTSRYNWKLFTNNAANDWYFEDFGYSEIGDADSTKFIKDVKTAGSHPLMTMVMLPWVAKSAENGTTATGVFRSRSMARSAASIPTTPMPAMD